MKRSYSSVLTGHLGQYRQMIFVVGSRQVGKRPFLFSALKYVTPPCMQTEIGAIPHGDDIFS